MYENVITMHKQLEPFVFYRFLALLINKVVMSISLLILGLNTDC